MDQVACEMLGAQQSTLKRIKAIANQGHFWSVLVFCFYDSLCVALVFIKSYLSFHFNHCFFPL
jgi:hypothetical protein